MSHNGPVRSVPVTYLAPAKVNLTLRVVGRRSDGYHLLESWMVFFPLYDRLTVTVTDGELGLLCDPAVTGAPEENLVWRAARLLKEHCAVSLGARLELCKRIPHGAGLGGGSSDAALTLLALNRHWGLHLNLETLIGLGVGLGADIPFFLRGCAALVEGIGERLTPLEAPLAGELVLLFPGAGLATRRVFQGLAGRYPTRAAGLGMPPVGADLSELLENDLELVALEFAPVIGEALAVLRGAGARATLMSGSGSTVFGVFPDAVAAEAAVEQVGAAHPEWRLFAGGILNVHPFHAGDDWESHSCRGTGTGKVPGSVWD
ncbi:MAG: 4-(cytidine 5'-diphospho)-2-C-methyl-D-erythritol kinase [Magnetococcus sp. YQC-9]